MLIDDIRKEKIGICVSGGLDSRTITKALIEEGIDVLCFTADLGQPDERDVEDIRRRMKQCGAETVIVDLKDRMAKACLMAIKAQAMYDGGYWNTTGLGRAVTVSGILPEMRKHGCTVLAHGATGRGNDQVRFERYTKELAPDIKVYAPWRDPYFLKRFPGRKQMVEYLESYGIKVALKGRRRYSTDANLGGISYEAEDLESLETPCTIVEPQMGVWPEKAPDEGEEVEIEFIEGYPVAINGERYTDYEIMCIANKIAGRNGVGLKNAIENRILGSKSRGVYEAPGMELLGRTLQFLYQAVFDRRSTDMFTILSRIVGCHIYEGRLFELSTRAALSAIDILAKPASGKVRVKLFKGNIYFLSLTECKGSLYNPADSSMEESAGLNPADSEGFLKVHTVDAVSMAKAGHITDIFRV